MIPFNKPYLHGRELVYIAQAVTSGKISGDGPFSKKCHEFFECRFGFKKALLTTSCTDALELAALLLNIRQDDEVIVPSFTFVSSANAFALRGAKLVFADSGIDNPNINCDIIESLITPFTRAIVVVHYAGVACDMDKIMAIATHNNILVVEDAAQAVDSYYKGRALGSIGSLGAFSFHETKNIVSGEGGMLTINDENYSIRAEVLREKGTNRSAFFRGEVDKYGWVEVGSSFLPSDINAAYLLAQLENLDAIQIRRKRIWDRYWNNLMSELPRFGIQLPTLPEWSTNNGHMFYIVCRDLRQRTGIIQALKNAGVLAVFHYLSLHSSPYFKSKHEGTSLPNSDRFSDCLVRLPLFFELLDVEVDYICERMMHHLKNST